jgi:hypothetical protein
VFSSITTVIFRQRSILRNSEGKALEEETYGSSTGPRSNTRSLGRVPAVLVTVLLALSILGGVGWTLTRQLTRLADELPGYSLNIHHRIADLREASKGGSMEKVQKAVEDVVDEIHKADTPGVRPEPVFVVLEPPSLLVHLPSLFPRWGVWRSWRSSRSSCCSSAGSSGIG